MTQNANKVLFREEQRYKKPRINYIITAVVVTLVIDLAFMARQLLTGDQEGSGGEKTGLLIAMLIIVATAIAFLLIFTKLKMITTVTGENIHVHYPPIMRKGKSILKDEIERFEIRQYNPLIEFGGWGIKTRGRPLRRRRYGIALTAYGRTGLQLYLRNGTKILIGTQRAEPLRHAVNKMITAGDKPEGEERTYQ